MMNIRSKIFPYIFVGEGDKLPIFFSFLNLVFKNSKSFLLFSIFIIKSILISKILRHIAVKNIFDKYLFKNIQKSKFLSSYTNLKSGIFYALNNKPNIYIYKKEFFFKDNIDIIDIFVRWTINLYFYIKIIKFRYIKRKNVLLFSNFKKIKKLNSLSRIEEKVFKNTKFILRNIKSILNENKNFLILWARFISEVYFSNDIFYLLEIIYLLARKNYILFNSKIIKKIFSILELISGNTNIKNENTKKLWKIKNIFYFFQINSDKIPGKIEKLFSTIIVNKTFKISDLNILNFFFKFGLVDLSRKIILKTIIYSNGNFHSVFLRHWFAIEAYYNSKGIVYLIFISFINHNIKIVNEISFILTKNLNFEYWHSYMEYLKTFLEITDNYCLPARCRREAIRAIKTRQTDK